MAAGALAAVTSLGGAAQSSSTLPVFDVASVKPTNKSGISLVQLLPGGRFRATNFSLQGLITRAWRVQQNQVEGGPGWIRSTASTSKRRPTAILRPIACGSW